MVFMLTSCKPKEDEQITSVEFNNATYTFEEVSDSGYDLFVGDGHLLEILYSDESFIISIELEDNIYIITGDVEQYIITKNGTTILIDGLDKTPTGLELVEWNEDIIPIMEAYTK